MNSLPIKIRGVRTSDISLIKAVLRYGIRINVKMFTKTDTDDFNKFLDDQFSKIFGRLEIFVICDSTEDNLVYSFLVAERSDDKDIIHWVFTKNKFRRLGFCKELLRYFRNLRQIPAQNAEFSFFSGKIESIISKYYNHIKYNPFNFLRS